MNPSLTHLNSNKKKTVCLLAYSGGLDTSSIIPWLKENYNFEIIAFCCNVGNLPKESELREKALHLGANEFVYEDSQEEFVSEYVYPMIKAGATYFDDYLLGTAIARPLIAKKLAQYAIRNQIKFIAHGATGKGNDHVRFEKAWAFLCPEVQIIAPWKIWNYRSREELISYLESKGIPWDKTKKAYSVDTNNFHRSCEGGDLENIETEYQPELVQEWIPTAESSNPSIASTYEFSVSVKNGNIYQINGETLSPLEVLNALNQLGSQYGIGLCDIVEERLNGIKSRGVYETPGGTLAHIVLKNLKQICWSKELYFLSQMMGDRMGQLIYEGFWFSDVQGSLKQYFETACEKLTGTVQIQLINSGRPGLGSYRILKRISPNSLYSPQIVSFDLDSMDIHKSALGYTKILTLSSYTQGMRERLTSKEG